MLKFARAAFLLLLPIALIEIVFGSVVAYFGLNPDRLLDLDMTGKFGSELADIIFAYGTAFFARCGVPAPWDTTLAAIAGIALDLAAFVTIAGFLIWLGRLFARYEIYVLKQFAELWKNRKAAPS